MTTTIGPTAKSGPGENLGVEAPCGVIEIPMPIAADMQISATGSANLLMVGAPPAVVVRGELAFGEKVRRSPRGDA